MAMQRFLSVFMLLAVTGSAVAIDPPNVVFIMADDLGWGDLGCYGNQEIKTPRIDQLASEGVLATNYNSCGCVCSPARAAIVTGRFPPNVGVLKALQGNPEGNVEVNQVHFVDPDLLTVADVMQAAGYVTGHYGKWHLGSRAPGLPGSTINLANYGYEHSRCTACGNNNRRYQDDPEFKSWNSTERIVDDSIDFLRAHAGRALYLQVWLTMPHAPVDPTPEQASAYFGGLVGDNVHGWTAPRHAYYATVTDLDTHVGRLLDELDTLGLAENTIVIFTSDNGPASIWAGPTDHSGVGHAGPFRGGKHSLYEGGVRMPLIVRWPALIPAGSVTDHPLSGVDWLPTMATIGASAIEQPHDGVSILYPLVFPTQPWVRETPRFAEWRFGPQQKQEHRFTVSPGAAVWSPCGRWKLLRNRDGTRLELYDLVNDPMERDNVVKQHPQITADLVAQLLAWQGGLPACAGCESEGDDSYPWPKP